MVERDIVTDCCIVLTKVASTVLAVKFCVVGIDDCRIEECTRLLCNCVVDTNGDDVIVDIFKSRPIVDDE